jgi:transcriptional regulator with XRE-family HTH domain
VGRKHNERPNTLGGCVGRQIETRRKAKDWTAAQLAEHATAAGFNMSRTFVTDIESARSSPSLDAVVAIAHSLGIAPRTLLAGCKEWTTAPVVSEKERKPK